MEGHFHIITRKKAEELGIRFFFTGKPCRNHGNYWLRGVNRGKCWCPDCKKDRRESGYRNITEEKKEMARQRARSYWTSDEYKAKRKEREQVLINWGLKKKRVLKENQIQRSRERQREWISKNREIHDKAQINSKVKRKYPDAMPKEELELNEFILIECIKLKRLRKEITGHDWHIDHMIPLSKGGKHSWDNLQVIPWLINIMKKNRMIFTKPHQWFDFA